MFQFMDHKMLRSHCEFDAEGYLFPANLGTILKGLWKQASSNMGLANLHPWGKAHSRYLCLPVPLITYATTWKPTVGNVRIEINHERESNVVLLAVSAGKMRTLWARPLWSGGFGSRKGKQSDQIIGGMAERPKAIEPKDEKAGWWGGCEWGQFLWFSKGHLEWK